MFRHEGIGEVQCGLQFSNRAAIFLGNPPPLLNVINRSHSRKHSVDALGCSFKL